MKVGFVKYKVGDKVEITSSSSVFMGKTARIVKHEPVKNYYLLSVGPAELCFLEKEFKKLGEK